MTAPVTVRERDLRALAGIVSEDRPDMPDGEGLPLSLLAELTGQIRCDAIVSGLRLPVAEDLVRAGHPGSRLRLA